MATLLIGQSGGPSPVVNASLAGALAEARNLAIFDRIYGLRFGMEGLLNEALIDLTDMPDAALHRLASTPGAALGSGRFKLEESDDERALAVLQAHDVRYFAYIGGNGSMYVCDRLARLMPDLCVIGVPKTIDNDLASTDHAPGYGSAARFLALATRDAGLDLQAMITFDDVVILEAMGRNTGWLAAACALLKETEDDAPHLVYVPEIPFDETRFLDDVRRLHGQRGGVFVVVAEGIRDAHGKLIGYREARSARDTLNRPVHSLTAGPSTYFGELVRDRLGLKARVLRPGTIGRSSSACVSEVDRDEAWMVGVEAVRQLAAGRSGLMIALKRSDGDAYACSTETVILRAVASAEKSLPREYMDEAGTMPSNLFRAYALPLIGSLPASPERLHARPVARRLSGKNT